MSLQILDGKPNVFGALPAADGVNFAVFSRGAVRVFLDLFKEAHDAQPYATIELDSVKNKTGDIWHVFVKGIGAGALYLYRVDGEYNPPRGNRFNVNKYLLDPYAKAFTRGSVFRSYNLQRERGLAGIENGKLSDLSDFPKCVVVDDNAFDWQGDRPLHLPLQGTILYETHLRGFTASESSQVFAPGTYKGFIEKIPYLKELGITAVEFLPVFEFDENENGNINQRTGEKLANYWGYSTIGFFAPKTTFSSDVSPGAPVREFKELVRALHAAGIEVILDVVFNHTAEGNEHGYTFSMRGFENSVYYLLPPNEKQYYMNYSGCGNTVNGSHPIVSRFIIDCLRYWVSEMHVDGFRFDLASALTRDRNGNVQGFPFLTNAIAEDPVLAGSKVFRAADGASGTTASETISGVFYAATTTLRRRLLRVLPEVPICTITAGARRRLPSILLRRTTVLRSTIWLATTANIMMKTGRATATAPMTTTVTITDLKGRRIIQKSKVSACKS